MIEIGKAITFGGSFEELFKLEESIKRLIEKHEKLSNTPKHLLRDMIEVLFPKDQYDFYYTTRFPAIKDCIDTDPIMYWEKGFMTGISNDMVSAPYDKFVEQMINRKWK